MGDATTARHRHYATTNPYTGETVREYDTMSREEVDRAVRAAHEAFTRWRRWPVDNRAAIALRAADLMIARREALARLVTLEMGKLIGESFEEVELSARILRYYGDEGPRIAAPQPLDSDAGDAVLVDEPVGALLGVEPWNYPLYQVARFAAPNLVLGNTILLKHAESVPKSALAVQELMDAAGIPTGVYQNLFANYKQIEDIIGDRRIVGVSLTGSERAGSVVASIAGRNLK